MFAGIIQSVSPILSVIKTGECLRVRIKKPSNWKVTLGQSISVDGVCSTVVSHKPAYFEVEYMPETLAKTTVKTYKKGRIVNLERSLTLKDFVDGGLVQGHVDARGKVKKIEKKGKTALLEITVPKNLGKYIAEKGSVTINGVNLTIVKAEKDFFSVVLIPFTLAHTNLGLLKSGEEVNVEVDMLARYVVAALRK